jgi:hypothetical protein
LVCSFDITTQSGLKLAESEVFHFPTKITRLGLEALDPFQVLEGEPIELARIDQEAQGELFLAILLDHVLVARDRAAGDLRRFETAYPSGQYIDGTSHARMLIQK